VFRRKRNRLIGRDDFLGRCAWCGGHGVFFSAGPNWESQAWDGRRLVVDRSRRAQGIRGCRRNAQPGFSPLSTMRWLDLVSLLARRKQIRC
jgi:hypothetical protein